METLRLTPTEKKLRDEIEQIVAERRHSRIDILRSAVGWWTGPGRLINPRQWKRMATAADRLLAFEELCEACNYAATDIHGLSRMTAAEIRDEIQFIADYQG